jgi:hypothetical protein
MEQEIKMTNDRKDNCIFWSLVITTKITIWGFAFANKPGFTLQC